MTPRQLLIAASETKSYRIGRLPILCLKWSLPVEYGLQTASTLGKVSGNMINYTSSFWASVQNRVGTTYQEMNTHVLITLL